MPGVEIGLPPREEVIVGERLCRLPVVTGWKSELWKSEYTVHEYDPIPAHKPSLRSRKALQGRQRSRFFLPARGMDGWMDGASGSRAPPCSD